MTALLEVDNLKIHAPKEKGDPIPIVKGVSFDVKPGQVVVSDSTSVNLYKLAMAAVEGEASTSE